MSGDTSVWGSPVVVDGVPLLPDIECLVPAWLRQEFFVRTSGLSVSEDHHYVYPGVLGPLLLPSDYIRKYFFQFATDLLILAVFFSVSSSVLFQCCTLYKASPI